jgi:hypothetical protein
MKTFLSLLFVGFVIALVLLSIFAFVNRVDQGDPSPAPDEDDDPV